MAVEHTVTPVDEFQRWKREGEGRLQNLIAYRDSAQTIADAALDELAAVDKAIAELCALLGRVSPTLLKGDP